MSWNPPAQMLFVRPGRPACKGVRLIGAVQPVPIESVRSSASSSGPEITRSSLMPPGARSCIRSMKFMPTSRWARRSSIGTGLEGSVRA